MSKKSIIILSVIIILGSACYFEGGRIKAFLYPRKYSVYVEKYSKEYNLDENFVYSIIKAESKFNPNALSHKGAKGLMQIADITRDWAIVELDLDENIDIYDRSTVTTFSIIFSNLLSFPNTNADDSHIQKSPL